MWEEREEGGEGGTLGCGSPYSNPSSLMDVMSQVGSLATSPLALNMWVGMVIIKFQDIGGCACSAARITHTAANTFWRAA